MIPSHNVYATADRIDPADEAAVAYWAKRWSIDPSDLRRAIMKVGPRLNDVAPEIWKLL